MRNQVTKQELQELKTQYSKKQIHRLYWRQCLADIEHLFIQKDLIKPFFTKQRIFLEGCVNKNDEFKCITIIRAGRRTSKSISTAIKCYTLLYFGYLFGYDMQMVIGAPDANDTKHIWRYLNLFWDVAPLSDVFDDCNMVYNNYLSKSTNKKQMSFSNHTEIVTGAANDPAMDDFRGEGIDYFDIDEFGNVNYKDELLQAAAYSLKDMNRLNMMDLIGTPDVKGTGKEFNHLFNLGQEGSDNVVSYHLKGSDNPYTDQRSAQTAKEIVTEDAYLKEEMGEAIPQHGRLFYNFKAKTQIKKLTFDPQAPLMGGMDFGCNKPYFCFWQYINGTIKVLHEMTPKMIRIPEFIPKIKALMLGKYESVGFSLIGCDPAGDHVNDVVNYEAFKLFRDAFPTAQYTNASALRSKANQVILYDALMIQNRLEVDESCEALITSIAMASPDKNQMGAVNSPGWKKTKGIDDPLDGLMYGLINFAPTAEMIKPIKKTEPMTEDTAIQIAELMAG